MKNRVQDHNRWAKDSKNKYNGPRNELVLLR